MIQAPRKIGRISKLPVPEPAIPSLHGRIAEERPLLPALPHTPSKEAAGAQASSRAHPLQAPRTLEGPESHPKPPHPHPEILHLFELFGSKDFSHLLRIPKTSFHLVRSELAHFVDQAVDLLFVRLGVLHHFAKVRPHLPHLLEDGFAFLLPGLPELLELCLLFRGQVQPVLSHRSPLVGLTVERCR
jgi:hypothetical protein